MKTLLFFLAIVANKAVKDNLPDLNYKSVRLAMLNSDPLTAMVRTTQISIVLLFFIIIDLAVEFGLFTLAQPGVIEYCAKILTCLAFTEVLYRIFSFVIEQFFPATQRVR